MEEHFIAVDKLRALLDSLDTLRPDDTLVVNSVKNFSIVRHGKIIGYIDLRSDGHKIEIYDKVEDVE